MSNSSQNDRRLEQLTSALRELSVPEGPDAKVKVHLLRQIADVETHQESARPIRFSGGPTMRRYLATAATILVLLGAYLYLLPSNKETPGNLFAAMLEQVKQVRTATLIADAQTTGVGLVSTKIALLDPGWMRQEISMSGKLLTIQIMNQHEGKMLSLVPASKEAMLIDMSGIPTRQKQESIIEEFRKLPSDIAVFEGQEMLGETATSKFVYDLNGMNYTIWISAETKMPIKIVMANHVDPAQADFLVTMTNFNWGADVDESLFTLDLPEGYTLKQENLDLAPGKEDDFAAMMRTFVRLNHEQFPDAWNALTPATIGNFLMPDPELEKEQQKQQVLRKMAFALGKPQDIEISKEQASTLAGELQQVIIRGSTYFGHLQQDYEWHYQGKGVKLGDADQVVAWWSLKPEKAKEGDNPKTAFVMYGDVRIETMPVDKLPQSAGASD